MDKLLEEHSENEQDDINFFISDESGSINEIDPENTKRDLPVIPDHSDKLLKQRHNQRRILFKYCLSVIGVILAAMFLLLFLQIIHKFSTGDDLISPAIYNTVFVSVIVQFIGVIYIIAKNLWDERGMFQFYKGSKDSSGANSR